MNSNTVTVHALAAGNLTLPERFFVRPASETARRTVPSLSFLIQHHNVTTHKVTRIVFDLGIRREIAQYSAPIQRHILTRQPLTTDPDVVKSLAAGGLSPNNIDFVIYSHVSWRNLPYRTPCERGLTKVRSTGITLASLGISRRALSLLDTVLSTYSTAGQRHPMEVILFLKQISFR